MDSMFILSLLGYKRPYEAGLIKILVALKDFVGLNNFLLVGGVAARIVLADSKVPVAEGALENIDIAVDSLSRIPADILRTPGFWLAYKNEEFINILDRQKDLRIHVFTTHIPPEKYIKERRVFQVGWVRIPCAEWLFARMLIDLQRVLDPNTVPVDPKQFMLTKALRQIVDEKVLSTIWKDHFAEHSGHREWSDLWYLVLPYEGSDRVVADPFNMGPGKNPLMKLGAMAKYGPYSIYKRIVGGSL